MCEVVKDLSDANIKQVADYLAKQKFVRAAQSADAALAAKGQQIHKLNCEKCHSSNGSAADDDAGILAGQWMPYLKEQIALVKAGTRKSSAAATRPARIGAGRLRGNKGIERWRRTLGRPEFCAG